MSGPRNTGIIRLDMGFLGDLLHLPDGHRIVAARQSNDFSDTIELKIDGPLMPDVPEGQMIPRVNLLVTVTETDEVVRTKTFVGKFTA